MKRLIAILTIGILAHVPVFSQDSSVVAPASTTAVDSTAASSEEQKAIEMEKARQEFEVTKANETGEKVLGVVPMNTMMEGTGFFATLLKMSDGSNKMEKDAFLYSIYLRGYLASDSSFRLADIDESRLAEARKEIEAGQLDQRKGDGVEDKWMGIDAMLYGKYGYAPIDGWGSKLPLKHTQLKVTALKSGETFTVIGIPPAQQMGSSDPLMAEAVADDLKDMMSATAEQRQMIAKINLLNRQAGLFESSGSLTTLLTGGVFAGAGVLAGYYGFFELPRYNDKLDAMQRARTLTSEKNKEMQIKPIGFQIASIACMTFGAVFIGLTPINPIYAKSTRSKERKLKKAYNAKYGEKYIIKDQ